MLLTAALMAVGSVYGGEFSLHGRASSWLGASRDSSYRVLAGTRYLPEARVSLPISKEFTLDAEASVNGFVSANMRPFDPPVLEARIKPYRGFVRLSSARFEARAGLQKINFGSAMLLRPLMWFDRVDPRDPLELTDGVYGLLARYYFQNNTNIWAWGLLGNSSPKGWEQVGSVRWAPEPGARVQVPIPRGEVAATYHHRVIDYSHADKIPEMLDEQDEDRLGLDAKVDLGVGLLVEGTLSRETRRLSEEEDPPVWTRLAVVGVDYTFGIGSGLGVTAEHMLMGGAAEPFGRGTGAQFSALMLGLPLGLLDNLRGMVYYDWKNEDPYGYLGWQRTLDNWIFSVGAFWNPASVPASAAGPVTGVAGKGVRLDVVFNH
jgi:hypothetical protein